MGKTSRSSSRLSRQESLESEISERSSKSGETMGKRNKKKKSKHGGIHKPNIKLREHREAQNKIEKLKKVFEDLRNQSNHSIHSAQDVTVIVLDDTIQSPNNKRKHSESNILEPTKHIKLENNPAAIVDDDVIIVNKTPRKNLDTAPKDCSTPIANTSKEITQNNNTVELENFNAEVNNLTKEINRDSYLTIDLTRETTASRSNLDNTVIDLDATSENQDCTIVTMSNSNLSMRNSNLSLSGESDVTVLNNLCPKKKKVAGKSMNSFVNGIAKLNATEKGKLLELITQNIFNGCNVSKKNNINTSNRDHVDITETVEDTFIKEVILGKKPSRNSIGSNIYNPEKELRKKTGLRMIVIDGSNVAMEHGKGRVFSVRGLKICIDYFLRRGHVVKAFVPRFRCRWGKSTEPRLLDSLERLGLVVYTPSREIQGRLVTSYDDRYIVQCAAEFDGVIVSGDNYRDLLQENPRWRFVIENRLLPFTWVDDMLMFPKDPLGRNGPSLEAFLKFPPESQHQIVIK